MSINNIGFWRAHADPSHKSNTAGYVGLPFPEPNTLTPSEASTISRCLSLLEKRIPRDNITSYRGMSTCRLCPGGDVLNGSVEYSWEGFTWPEGLVHYIERHRVRPPNSNAFFEMIKMEEKKSGKPLPPSPSSAINEL
eukprot:PhM_4_TR2303/c0_g1_i1/m.103159